MNDVPHRKPLALTYDDGPDPVWTVELLDVLAAAGVQATFFPIGACVAAHPHLIRRIVADGHAVGLHCQQHVRHSHRDRAWLRRDTQVALHVLSWVGVSPALWRTPWGDTAAWTEEVAVEHHLRVVHWTVDTHDWRGDTAERMLETTKADLTEGAIVLAHDGIGPGARRTGAAETVRYTELVIEHVRSRGLTLRGLG